MKVSTFVQGGYSGGGFSFSGGTLTGTLVLAGNPTMELEAAPKQYVDAAMLALNASNLTSGTIPVARLPAMSGDASNTAGSDVITLAASGVTAGTYPKVVVDAKGRVTGGSALVAADIPSLDWSKIGSGKPTTLSGYGITNGLVVGGGTLTGFLTLHANPTLALHAATKGYVDSALGTASGLDVGDIVRKPYVTTPSGFLKCNGSSISKTTYAALFTAIGDTFSITGTQPGNGRPWHQQYQINTEQSGNITGWTAGTSLPEAISKAQVIVTNSKVYLLGGADVNGMTDKIYMAPINADGTLGAWSISGYLVRPVYGAQAFVTKNRAYLVGGYDANNTRGVYTATISADGTLGGWSQPATLPDNIRYGHAVITNNRVYCLGNNSLTTYYAPINADGTLGTFVDSSLGGLPTPRSNPSIVVIKDYIYAIGGESLGSGYNTNNVSMSTISASGVLSKFSDITSFPIAISQSNCYVSKNKVYIFGGMTGTSSGANSAVIYSAIINADGTLGTWVTDPSLPVTIKGGQLIVTKNKIHIIGCSYTGDSGGGSGVYTATISGGLNDYSPYYNGTIALTDPANFRLPDASTIDASNNTYHYVKY